MHKRGIASPIKTASIYHRGSTCKEQCSRQRVQTGRYANEKHGAYAFSIHGSVHLLSPELIPNPSNVIQRPNFVQIYIFDSANELQNRLNVTGNSDVRPHTMQFSEQPNGIENIQFIFRAESDTDIRRYNAPTADEIGVLIVSGEDESSI
ncbi:hypothetical protein MAM1_0342c09853 [Mucor ambiguus]|uniref:Uncharacterized protein n=1 Tax=Mucor ambiguus TaxID=91626 RepID=A0A0C9LXQ2_9FUNG|nr:hypothetical protein MAM1_0342c09853 [Mucor ambiguus]